MKLLNNWGMVRRILVLALALGTIGATVAAFLAPPAKSFAEPDLARIIFFHLPCAFVTTVFVIVNGWFGFRYLISEDQIWDDRNGAALEMSTLFGALTLITGIIFSRVQWNAFWQWDTRQTSFLLVMLLLVGGLALRFSHPEENRRALTSAAYSAASLLPLLFLIFVFPRIPAIKAHSFHPSGAKFDPIYWQIILCVTVLLGVTSSLIFSLRVRLSGLERKMEHLDGNLETDLNGAAATGVVRPVMVSDDDRTTS